MWIKNQCEVEYYVKSWTVLAAAKFFYFQQQVTAGPVCSAASKTFALGNQPSFANIRTLQCALLKNFRTWQFSNGPLAQSLCEAGRASRRITPVDLRKSSNSVIAALIFSLLPNNTYQWSFSVQQRTIKVPANNIPHCTLAARPFPSQQRQATERGCITFSQISNHIYDLLIKMLQFFSSRFMHYHLDMRLLQGNHNMFCDIHIFLQQQQKRYISASKS